MTTKTPTRSRRPVGQKRKIAAQVAHRAVAPIGPSSDDYYRFANIRADLDTRMQEGTFNRHCGYDIWRNAWIACEIAHGIRTKI